MAKTTTTTKTGNLLASYLDPKHPGSLGGVKRFYEHNKKCLKNLEEAKHVLETSDVYTVNKPVRKKFQRNITSVTNLGQQYQADLADLKKFAKQNRGVQYILVVIDCFSKKVSVQLLKSKTSEEVLSGFQKAFDILGEPEKLQTDKGREFFNRHVSSFLKELRIQHFTSENDDIKCSIVERFIRTLKSRIWHLFRHRVSTKYIDHIHNIINVYNNTVHRSHGFTPNDVSQDNSLAVFNSLREKHPVVKRPSTFKVGDFVRISKRKDLMTKGYEYNFKEEVFQIVQVIPHTIPVYTLKDLLGELLVGKFYEQELVLVRNFDRNKSVTIDKVLQRKGNRIKVRWLGYGKEHDSWIDA